MVESIDPREALAVRIRRVLSSRTGVREVRMFGGLSFMVQELMAVTAGRDGDLLVRIDPARFDELVERGGTPAYMKDRSMGRGWITVPGSRIGDDSQLAYWVEVGIDARNASR